MTIVKCMRLVVVLGLVCAPPSSTVANDYTIRLKTAEFETQRIKNVSLQKSAELVDRHILIQFEQPIDEFTRSDLAESGVELLQYVPNLAYTARVRQTFDQDLIDRYWIRWFDEIEPIHKISPQLSDIDVLTWAHRDSETLQYIVVLHRDVDVNSQASYFQNALGAEVLGTDSLSNSINLILSDQAFYRLADLDEVIWVQPASPPFQPSLDNVRRSHGVDILQDPPYNLDGAGISVGIWDYGSPDLTHLDMANVTVVLDGDSAIPKHHATSVAGIVGGTGAVSGGLYRGMAPAANMYTYNIWQYVSDAQLNHAQAFTDYNARISNNSLNFSVYPQTEQRCDEVLGTYSLECGVIDEIIRGSEGYPFIMPWAAGNHRGMFCNLLGYVYGTVAPAGTSKNVTCVGASSYSVSSSYLSGWGPTKDGRIKPDVMAIGSSIYAPIPDYFDSSTWTLHQDYLRRFGTSFSTAAVSGIYALLLQQSDILYPGETFAASTYRGILINTATDLDSEGPNYETGWGSVNALEAIKAIGGRDSSWFEESISMGETDEFDLTITTNKDLKVALLWDDPGTTIISGPTLVNDLELILIDPENNEYDPWVLRPSNPAVPASKGKDHVNNIEVVSVKDPVPGLWKARVNATNVPAGPQKYSLVMSPYSIHTPGNTIALAIYEPPFTDVNPGEDFIAEFEIINAGLAADLAHITITDDVGWLVSSVDTMVFLTVGQSTVISATVSVPPGAFGWEEDHVECVVVSGLNPAVVSRTTGIVGANSVYAASLVTTLSNLTKNSPDTFSVTVEFSNDGNDYDELQLQLSSSSDWSYNRPNQLSGSLAPSETHVFSFDAYIPREEVHDNVVKVNLDLSTDGGALVSTSFDVTINNPYPPPTLSTPVHNTFTQNQVFSFSWEDMGADSYQLHIGIDSNASFPVRVYPGIITNSFSMPIIDSLPDYTYWWGVRRIVGSDSSSLQRYPHRFIVDNMAPPQAFQIQPLDSSYVGPPNFICFLAGIGGGEEPGESPQYVNLEFCQEPTFTTGVISKIGESDPDYEMDEVLALGRWYWRVQHADSAGNLAAWSSTRTFIMDWEAPPIPTVIYPVDRSYLAPSSINFQWTIGAPPVYEHAPIYYRFQIASDSQYIDNIFDQYLSDTSIAVISGGLFTADSTYFWRVKAFDSAGNASSYQSDSTRFLFSNEPPPSGDCGDINGNNTVNISDLTFLVSYLFGVPIGPAPDPLIRGSVNCDDKVNISDITYLVAYLFGVPTGPEPCCL